jgi:hypothetical protein
MVTTPMELHADAALITGRQVGVDAYGLGSVAASEKV